MVFMPYWPKPLSTTRVNYSMDNMHMLLNRLSMPHLHLPPVIHIAGTNGKGSTNAFIRSIAKAAGLSYHSYTSPHLLDFNERIVINGEKINDSYLFELCEKVRITSEKISLEPTFFEATTAISFLAFMENDADLLILETGLGGRLDATNVVENPLLCIITPISFDHMDTLGHTLQDIAYEKSCIIKHHTPCVISNQLDIVSDVLIQKAKSENAPYITYGRDFDIQKLEKGFNFTSEHFTYDFPLPALKGDHQILNAATAIAALSLGQKKFNFLPEYFVKGIQNTIWPARIQKISKCKKFLPKDINPEVQIWIDGAHNQHGAQVLANWIKDDLKGNINLIIGMTKNRDAGVFLNQFTGIFKQIYTVPVQSEPHSYSAEQLTRLASQHGIHTTPCTSLEDALNKQALNVDHIVITGSLFLSADTFKLANIII